MSCSRVVLRKWIRDHVWGQVARGLSREDHGAKSLCEEHGILPFRWPWLFRNLVVRLRLSWEERVECKLTSQAMKR